MNISIIGGDKRNQILAKMFENEKHFVYKCFLGLKSEVSFSQCISNSDVIVTGIPFSKDSKTLNTPLSEKKITISDFLKALRGKNVFVGNISEKFREELEQNGNKVIDVMRINDMAVRNAIPTAEGIIDIIINNTNCTIDGSNILVIGYGRVGKRTALVLKKLGANVSCTDVKKDELANIALSGYNVIENISQNQSYDVIVNTVPELVLGEEKLKCIEKKALIIDVASNPGGVDYDYAYKHGYNVIHELGIPGKIAPETVARNIKQIIYNSFV